MSVQRLLVLFFCALACAAFCQELPVVYAGDKVFIQEEPVVYDLRPHFVDTKGKPLVEGVSLCVSSRLPAGLELSSSSCTLSGRPPKVDGFSTVVSMTARNGESALLKFVFRVRPAYPILDRENVLMWTYPITVGEVKPGELVMLMSRGGPFTAERFIPPYDIISRVEGAEGVSVWVNGQTTILRYIDAYRVGFEAPLSLQAGEDALIEVRSPRGTVRVTVPVRQ